MSQIKVKKLTSLLLSTNTLNTLCASAWVFPLEQEKEVCDFFHLLFVDGLGFFIIHTSKLLMPLLTPDS